MCWTHHSMDDKPNFGAEGEMPENRIAKAFVEASAKSIKVSCMYNRGSGEDLIPNCSILNG